MNLELPEGFTARPMDEADVDVVVELLSTAEEHDDGASEIDPEDIQMGFGRVGFDRTRDAMLVFDGSLLVAYGEVYRGRAEIEVRPSHRRRGLGGALLGWSESRARELGTTELGQSRTDADVEARELLLSRGYTPRWDSWILRIELDAPVEAPTLPEGVEIRRYEPERDLETAHRIWEDAFAPVRGREIEPLDVWVSQTVAHASFSPGLSRVAVDGDEAVATLLAYDFAEAGETWIGQVATVASHRRRGIAGALLRSVFVAAREAGRVRCGLSTESHTGARSLYERVGMHVVRSYTRYAKPLV